MRRLTAMALAGLLAFGLGCAGMTETLVEVSTGGQMEIDDEGNVTMTMPDGSTVVTETNGSPPEDFPLPVPWEGATPQALVINTSAEGEKSWILTYGMEAPKEEITQRYRDWLEAHATDVKENTENTAGIVSTRLVGTVDGGMALITLTEAYGSNSVNLVWAPHGEDSLPNQE